MSDRSAGHPWSRRALLRGVATVPGAALAGAATAGEGLARKVTAPVPVRIATWNVYLGVALDRLFEARSLADVRTIAGDLLTSAREHPYEARAGAIADALVAADADVIALQEVARVRTTPREEGGETETVIDLLAALRSALAERGHPYEVAAATTTTDVTLPADTESGVIDLRLTDRVVVLTTPDVEVRDDSGDTYDHGLLFPVPETDRIVALERGYCRADLRIEGAALTVVSTHLESVSAWIRQGQALELLDALGDGPVAVGADLNSGPGTTTTAYETVTETLTDAHAARRPDGDGETCCQAPSLRNERSQLATRIDAVLTRGASVLSAVERLGADPADRVEATVDGESVTVWPSDHAGVAATVAFPSPTPTATPTQTATPSPTDTPSPTPSPSPRPTRSPSPTARQTAAPSGPTTGNASTAEREGAASGAGAGFGGLAALVAFALGALARSRE
jgi:endonuclease/exonuclease/phosphatase family metal-dependent hydrolase